MLALTLHQPWATLIALGEKRFETRDWEADYTGLLAIHAGKTLDRAACDNEPFYTVLSREGLTPETLPTGALLCMVYLRGCYPAPNALEYGAADGDAGWEVNPAEHEGRFGNFAEGRFAWALDEVMPLPAPVPCRGYQKLWHTPANLDLPALPQT